MKKITLSFVAMLFAAPAFAQTPLNNQYWGLPSITNGQSQQQTNPWQPRSGSTYTVSSQTSDQYPAFTVPTTKTCLLTGMGSDMPSPVCARYSRITGSSWALIKRVPFTILLTALWSSFKRRASSDCDRPLSFSASRNCSGVMSMSRA